MWRSLASVLGLLCLLLLIRLWKQQDSFEDNRALQKNIKQLSEQNRSLKAELSALQLSIQNPSANQGTEPATSSSSAASNSAKSGRSDQSSFVRQEFREALLQSSIKEITQMLSVNESEKEAIAQAMREEWALAREERRPTEQIIAEVVGQERAEQYKQLAAEHEEKTRLNDLNMKVATIGRALSLNSEQEPLLLKTLSEIDDEMKPLTDELSKKVAASHSSNASPQERAAGFKLVRESMEEMRATRRLKLIEKLRPSLSPEQFSKLVNEQASSPNALFGLAEY